MANVIAAKCTAHCVESNRVIQYFPGVTFNVIYDESDRTSLLDVNLADKHQRQLVWLKTPRGKWIISFDRANASNTQHRIFFCGDCGEVFERLNDIGTHSRSLHNKAKALASKVEAENADEEEAELLAKVKELEQAEETDEQIMAKIKADGVARRKAAQTGAVVSTGA